MRMDARWRSRVTDDSSRALSSSRRKNGRLYHQGSAIRQRKNRALALADAA